MNQLINSYIVFYLKTIRSTFPKEQMKQKQNKIGLTNSLQASSLEEQKYIDLQNQNSPSKIQKKGNTLLSSGPIFNSKYNLSDIDLVTSGIQDKQCSIEYNSNTALMNKKKLSRYQTFVKQNTFSFKLITAANLNILWFSQTQGYHSSKCCFDLIYTDDCWLKQFTDLLFHILFFPIKLIGYIAGFISKRICGQMICLVQIVKRILDALYSPFACFGTWLNQCRYSIKLFCCEEIEYLPPNSKYFMNGCCVKNCFQSGQCIKNCCSFYVDYKCCKTCDCSCLCLDRDAECCCQFFCFKIGDCFQNMLTPQGFCEDFFQMAQIISCNKINLECCEVLFCCCFKNNSIQINGNFIGKTSECCCCVLKTEKDFQL